MAGDLFGSNPSDRENLNAFHGISTSRSSQPVAGSSKPRAPTRITVPKDGSTPADHSSSRSHSYSKRRSQRKSTVPNHPTQFMISGDFHSDTKTNFGRGGIDLGTARRTNSHGSNGKRTPSPNPLARGQHSSPNNDIAVLFPTGSTSPNRGKGKARDVDPSPSRPLRSNPRRKASQQNLDYIDIVSDNEPEVEHIPSLASTSRMAKRQSDSNRASLALEAKANKRKKDAMTSSAAPPDRFYGRPDGPIRLEQPREPAVLVRDSASPELEFVSSHRLNRSSRETPTKKIIHRMKPRNPSPNAWAGSPKASPKDTPSKHTPSPTRSPRQGGTYEESLPGRTAESNGASHSFKRRRTDKAVSPLFADRSAEQITLPHEVRLDAIVVSDLWRSRDETHPISLFQNHHLSFGPKVNKLLRIDYSDILQVLASRDEVKDYGTLCFTLRPESGSAKRVTERFSEFDPRASGDAAQIQLIAGSEAADLRAHKQAVALVSKVVQKTSSEDLKVQWLDQAGARTMIGCVAGVRQLPWPSDPREARTLIVPGADRAHQIERSEKVHTGTVFNHQRSTKKTFNIQPASPTSAVGATVNVDMPDAVSDSKSPTLPSLTTPKSRLITYAAPKSDTRQTLAAPTEHILSYPYEGTGAVSVYGRDLERLQDGALLNDIVIEFGLKYMLEGIRARDPDLADGIHVFNTFFWKVLMDSPVETSYRKLRRWTTKVDLFAKKYIVIPINEDYHWYLAIIVNPGLMLLENDHDSGSEQDQEEVASALALARSTATPPPTKSAADGVRQAQADDHEKNREIKLSTRPEPSTPPLQAPRLPLPSAGPDAASTVEPMDVDKESRASTPMKNAQEPLDLNRTYIITFDSLGARHTKVGNKLHEYLWREALDKERLTAAQLERMVRQEEAKRPVQPQVEPIQTRAQDAALKQPGVSVPGVLADQVNGSSGDSANKNGMEKKAVVEEGGIRTVQVQDTRQCTEGTLFKPVDVEALAKRLPKTPYVDALVPTQPNFCDCGIYLLHYFDRFFHNPDKLLGLIVEVKRRLVAGNKDGPTKRKQQKDEAARSVELEWQAGEVSSKREYWRHTILDLSRGWKQHEKAKEAAEAMAKREKSEEKEPKLSGEHVPTEDGAGKEQADQAQAADVEMPEAQQASDTVEEASGPEQKKAASTEKANRQDMLGETPSHDIDQAVNDVVHGKDEDSKNFVESVIKQALETHHGPLFQDHLDEAHTQQQQQRLEPAQDLRTPNDDWLFNLSRPGPSSSSSLPDQMQDLNASQATFLPHASPLPQLPALEHGAIAAALPNRQQHQQQATPPPSFGSSILGPTPKEPHPQPQSDLRPLSFESSNDHHHRTRSQHEPDESDTSSCNSSASVAEIMAPSPSSASSADGL